MHYPRDTPAVDSLFARVMEMKLHQLVPLVTNADEAAGRVVDRNRELQDRANLADLAATNPSPV
jgi:hypothetical protein